MSRDQTITIELNPDEQRLYDRLRRQVVRKKEPGVTSGLVDLLLLLPDLTILLMRLLRDDRVPIAYKVLAVAGVAYVFSPIDLVPSLIFGPIGLVDDLVIVAGTLSRMLNRVHPDVVRSHWPGQGDALDAIHQVTAWTEKQVTAGLRQVFGSLLRR